jgi:hypothetical protein
MSNKTFKCFYFQSQLEKLQKQIAAVAKKTGISSATKLALIAPTKDIQEGQLPDIEWWDRVIIQQGRYEEGISADELQGITALIEHPVQKHPPGETYHYTYSRPNRLTRCYVSFHPIRKNELYFTRVTQVS